VIVTQLNPSGIAVKIATVTFSHGILSEFKQADSIVYVRDEKNRPIQEANYGLNGQPLKTYTEEVYMVRRKFDEYGREISESFRAAFNRRYPPRKTWTNFPSRATLDRLLHVFQLKTANFHSHIFFPIKDLHSY